MISFGSAGSVRTVRGRTPTQSAGGASGGPGARSSRQAEERRGGGAPLCVRDNTPTLSLLSPAPRPPAGDKLTESSCRLFYRRGGRLAAQGSRFPLSFFLVRSLFPDSADSAAAAAPRPPSRAPRSRTAARRPQRTAGRIDMLPRSAGRRGSPAV